MSCKGAAQGEECQVNTGTALVAEPQSAELVQPTDGSLHHPAVDVQLAAVVGVPLYNRRLDAPIAQLLPVRFGIVRPVDEDPPGPLDRMAYLAGNR